MSSINSTTVIKYGFVAVSILGSVIIIGAAFSIQYEIIPDGVARGIETAGGLPGGRPAETDERT